MQQQIIVLPEQSRFNFDTCAGKAAVFIHLHYRDTLCRYFDYITHVPEEVPIYISSSDKWVEEEVRKYAIEQKREITVFHKENRGRDITALLVTFREKMMQYEYVCFLHDKKEKRERDKSDITVWVENLWSNLLGSDGVEYFLNVLAMFEDDNNLGLLVPPEPIGDVFTPYNSWHETNIFLTQQLAEELGLHVNIDSDIESQPIALGTCFWARSAAIRKILEKKWTYEDFDDEPLPEDAKSYAVERIFGYLAEDAGYRACIIMNGIYAAIYMNFLRECRRSAFQVIENSYGVCNLLRIKQLKKWSEYASTHESIYIYGAGKIGRMAYRYLTDAGYLPRGFLVSQKDRDYSQMPIPVLCIDQFVYEDGMGIIIAVGEQYVSAVLDTLEERGIKEYLSIRW